MFASLSKSMNSNSAEAKKQSFTESEKSFFDHAKIHLISKDASIKCSTIEMGPWMRFNYSQIESVSSSISLFRSSALSAYISLNFGCVVRKCRSRLLNLHGRWVVFIATQGFRPVEEKYNFFCSFFLRFPVWLFSF